MRIILSKAERESAKSMKDAIVSYLEAEGVASASQNVLDDYSKCISVFRDQEGNTVIDIKTDFVKDVIGTFKKVGIMFIKVALPFAKTYGKINELLSELDDRWTSKEETRTRPVAKEDAPEDIREYIKEVK